MKKKLMGTFRGIKVQRINAILMIIGCLLTVLVFLSTFRIKSKYDGIISSMSDYTECSKALSDFREASDYLTNQIRLFAIHQDPVYMESYFYEINDFKRREIALDIIQMTHNGDYPDVNLTMAYEESELLSKKENYVMKLICEANNFNPEYIPLEVSDTNLTDKDAKLTSAEKLQEALSIIFGSEYVAAKNRINQYISSANTSLINMYVAIQKDGDAEIYKNFATQTTYTVILFIVCIGLYIILVVLVLVPLYNNLASIQKGVKMGMKGGFEVRYIAAAYNALCDKNAVTASILKHKAEHDPLTGLINRNAFDHIKEALINADEPIAYLIVDIDLFKGINDKYGHLVGDQVLKRIANLLAEQFRNSDYVARIGGDEFAVIMTKFGTTPMDIIQRKIDSLNKQLQTVQDGMPSVSLSVGVAFSENGYNDDLVARADKALYTVKRGGRCNCSFYNEEKSE